MNRNCQDCMRYMKCKYEKLNWDLVPCERFNHKTNLTANEYQELAARTINYELNIMEQETHAFCGMVSELGEMGGIYQKAYQGHTPDPNHMKKELGDLMWFIAEYCTAQGWTLEEVMIGNIEKLYGRYPDGFDAEHSLNRAEGDI